MVNISVSDLTKTYGSSTPLVATVTADGSPVGSVPVKFNINGVDYERYTNSEGVAMLNINLNIGAYECRVSYDGVTRKVLVRVIDKPSINLIVSNFLLLFYLHLYHLMIMQIVLHNSHIDH